MRGSLKSDLMPAVSQGSFSGVLCTLLFPPLVSGLLLSSAFPPWGLEPLAFVALVPLLWTASFSRGLVVFLLGYIAGVMLAGSFFHPLMEIEGFPVSGYLVIALLCGVFLGLFSSVFSLVTRRTRWPAVVIAPPLWVAVEFLRANIFFLSNPGFQIGYTQHRFIPLIQVASFTSVYGVSFVVVLVNALIADVLFAAFGKESLPGKHLIRRLPVARSAFIIFVLILIFVVGFLETEESQTIRDETVRVSLVQPNLTREERRDPNFRPVILDRYRELTIEASRAEPDLMVWPESSTPGQFKSDTVVFAMVLGLIRETGTPLVLGSSARDKTTNWEYLGVFRANNSAFLVNSDGKIAGIYKKIRLVPFWEYLPFEGSFPWPKWLVPEHGYTLPGDEATLFTVQGHPFGVVICWEVLFPDLYRRFTRQGPDLMLNLSNESVFGWTAAPYKVQAMAVFRAVESRTPLLRSGLTGMTSYIDRFGREIARITDAEGNDLMVEGFLTVDVPVSEETTFYTKYGDVFAWLCVTLSLLMVGCALAAKSEESRESLWGEEVV